MKKFFAILSLSALCFAFVVPAHACDADGKCKGKSSSACCMNKAAAKKSCCSTKGAGMKSDVKESSTGALAPVDASAKASSASKPADAPKVNPNK